MDTSYVMMLLFVFLTLWVVGAVFLYRFTSLLKEGSWVWAAVWALLGTHFFYHFW